MSSVDSYSPEQFLVTLREIARGVYAALGQSPLIVTYTADSHRDVLNAARHCWGTCRVMRHPGAWTGLNTAALLLDRLAVLAVRNRDATSILAAERDILGALTWGAAPGPASVNEKPGAESWHARDLAEAVVDLIVVNATLWRLHEDPYMGRGLDDDARAAATFREVVRANLRRSAVIECVEQRFWE